MFFFSQFQSRSKRMVSSTRSSSRNKRKSISSVNEIDYDAACNSLGLTFDLACPLCSRKQEQNLKLVKNSENRINNFRLISKRNKCEQRWSECYALKDKITSSQMMLHVRTCNYLKVTPLLSIEYKSYKHKRNKVDTNVPSIKPIPTKRTNPKNKSKLASTKPYVKSALPSGNAAPKLSRQIAPDFSSNNKFSKNYACNSIHK